MNVLITDEPALTNHKGNFTLWPAHATCIALTSKYLLIEQAT